MPPATNNLFAPEMAKNSPSETRTSRMAYCSKSLLPNSANWINRFQSISPTPSDRGCALTVSRPPALTVRQVSALSDLDNISVRVPDVAARLAVLGDRLRDELGSSALPQFIARLNIRNADIHKAADLIRVGEDAERYRRLVRGGPAPDVDNEPRIRDPNVSRRAFAVASALNAAAKDRFVEASRSVDVGDGEKMRDGEPLPRGHRIALLFDLYAAH